MDIKKMREHFPILQAKREDLVYLDSAATTQRPKMVIDVIHEFYTHGNSSVHRGVYALSEKATQDYEDAREKVAKFINASDASEIIFTSGTTESINFVSDTWGRDHIKSGDEILVTQVEHHANLLPWQRIVERNGAKLKFIEVDLNEYLMKDPGSDMINNKTKLVSLVQVSNVLGDVWREGQIKSIIEKAHAVGAKVLIDGAQSIPHQKFDVQDWGADFVAFSGHKMLGPTGVGVLYIKKDLHDEVEPYQVGGSMVHDADYEEAHWQEAPSKFEAGTPPIAQVIGMGAAIDFFNEHVDFDAMHKHEAMLCARMVEGLRGINGIKILGNQERMVSDGHLVAFTVEGVHAHDVSAMLGMKGVATRAGHHCVQPLAKLMGIEASARASIYMYNDMEDVEIFIRVLSELVKDFKKS